MLKIDFRYKFDPSRPKYMKFIVGADVFYVPYFGIIAKIIDFGFSIYHKNIDNFVYLNCKLWKTFLNKLVAFI